MDTNTDRGRKKGITSAGIVVGEYHSLFEAAHVLPVQFFSSNRKQPEKELMLAVLEDAIHCYFLVGGTEERIRSEVEARLWFSADDSSWPFSFENICTALEIDSSFLRKALEQKSLELSIVPLQEVLKSIQGRKILKDKLLVPVKNIVAVLKNKRLRWKEVYNMVFAFFFLCFARPKQTTEGITRYMVCKQEDVCHFSISALNAIKKREPYFFEALSDIADEMRVDRRVLSALLRDL